MMRKTRPISWIRAALKEFETFPEGATPICLAALTIAAEGGKADIAKPMHGVEPGCSSWPCRIVVTHPGWSLRGAARQ